jgi:adenylate cyclase
MTLEGSPGPRYRLVEMIGRGGMGEVWLADDSLLHRQVALKFLTSRAGHDASERLLAEARAAAALDHPYICSIYEVTAIAADRPCIVMEYVRGETLERRLRAGPLALADALRVAAEVAEAMEAAHRRRIVHGDLKPANVMITEDDHVKVMDFGLATRLAEAESEQRFHAKPADVAAVPGTPAYMAPEQVRGEAADRRSDIFAFGILLYELLSGANPFLRTGLAATVAAILDDPVPDLTARRPGVPPALALAVQRMLAKPASVRYQSFGDIRTDLRRLAIDARISSSGFALLHDEPAHEHDRRTLVGREAERAQLHDCLARAASGCGTLIVLSGEGGVGKTRLAEDALAAARLRGWQTFVGRCYEEEGTPPLIPYVELLEAASQFMPPAAFREAVGSGAAELARLLPTLHRLFPDMTMPLELPPDLRQRFLFTTVREFLARCSRLQPLVILIDDLQWADESTLQLTVHLAQHLSMLPIVCLAAFRDVEAASAASRSTLQHIVDRVRGHGRRTIAPQAIKATLHQLVAQGHARLIPVRPFGEADVQRMLAALAQQTPPAAVGKQFFDQTGGNPFFIAELFRHLNEEGRLFDGRNRWQRDLDFDELDVPESLRVVVERRLERVSAATQAVLRAAAVLGRPFDLDLLQAVAGVDNDQLVAALDEAEQARLIHGPSGRQETTWRFPHQLICQTLTQSMTTLRRQRLHLRAADAMERLGAAARLNSADLAHHLYSAGGLAPSSRTTRALLAAGDAAFGVYATDEALRHYRRAAEVLQHAGDDAALQRSVEERLADVLALVGDRAGALERYVVLAAAYDTPGAHVEHARVLRKMAALHWQSGDRSQAMALYDHARRVLDASAAPIEAAHLYQELGLAAFRSGDNGSAIEWAERALQSAQSALADAGGVTPEVRRAATAAIAHATNTIGAALARSGNLGAARERIEQSVTAARDVGLLDVACRAYANLGVLYSTLDPKRAIEVSLTGLELASKIGAPSLQSYIYANLAAAYCALTDGCETDGLEAARTAANLDRELGQLDHLAVPLIVMAQIHQCRGELLEAQRHYQEALALAERAGEPQLILPCYDGLATIALDRGDRARAEQYMEQGRRLCEQTGLDPEALLLLPFLS